MKYRRGLCIECNKKAQSRFSYLCSECFDKQLKTKIINKDRTVESPHASWY